MQKVRPIQLTVLFAALTLLAISTPALLPGNEPAKTENEENSEKKRPGSVLPDDDVRRGIPVVSHKKSISANDARSTKEVSFFRHFVENVFNLTPTNMANSLAKNLAHFFGLNGNAPQATHSVANISISENLGTTSEKSRTDRRHHLRADSHAKLKKNISSALAMVKQRPAANKDATSLVVSQTSASEIDSESAPEKLLSDPSEQPETAWTDIESEPNPPADDTPYPTTSTGDEIIGSYQPRPSATPKMEANKYDRPPRIKKSTSSNSKDVVFLSLLRAAPTASSSTQTDSQSKTNRPPAADQFITAQAQSFTTKRNTLLNAALLTTETIAKKHRLVFSIELDPLNGELAIEPDGIFTYLPDLNFHGRDSFVFLLDDRAHTSTAVVTITVNDPPVLQWIGDRSVEEGALLTFSVSASDPDHDPLTLTAFNLPEGASLDSQTGVFAWTPGYDQSGVYSQIRFEASDGVETDDEEITVTVTNVNRSPVLNPIGNQTVEENSSLAFQVIASDPDGDSVTITASDLESWMSFDGSTFQASPSFEDGGDYPITFTAGDGDLTAAETIRLSVGNVNRPPVLDPIADIVTQEGEVITIAPEAADLDGDVLSYSVTGLPQGADYDFDPETGDLTWRTNYQAAGEYDLTFTVDDGRN